MDDLSQGVLLPHLFRLRDSSAREDADSRCSGSFFEELFPGIMIFRGFLAIHFTSSKYSEKKSLCRLDIVRECFPTAMPVAEEEVDFSLPCFVDT